MSITRSYNKHTGIWYAYDTTYVWDESQKKKVQKKKCIGQFDPETGSVIPNGGRGRPRKEETAATKKTIEPAIKSSDSLAMTKTMEDISSRLSDIDKIYRSLEEAVNALGEDIARLRKQSESYSKRH